MIAFVTFPSIDVAREIAAVLVQEQLVACVNLIPAIESIYRWDGQVQRDAEVLATMKTTAESVSALEARVLALHPYDTPEFIVVEPSHVEARYAAWLTASCRVPSAAAESH